MWTSDAIGELHEADGQREEDDEQRNEQEITHGFPLATATTATTQPHGVAGRAASHQ